MKIIQLTTESFKKIDAIEIKPNGKPIVLTGDNAQGKSSILDSIYVAITGKLPDEPIKKGAKKATIRLNMGDISIERKITPSGSVLELKDAEGNKVSSPQKILNELLGALTFDPLEFTRLKPKEQRNQLMQVAGLNLDELDSKYKAAYDDRTLIGRELKKSEGHLNSLVKPEITEFELDITDLLESRSIIQNKIDDANKHEANLNEVKRRKNHIESQIESIKNEIQSLMEKLESRACELKSIDSELENLGKTNTENVSELKTQLSMIDSDISECHKNTEAIASIREYEKAQIQLAEIKKEYDAIDDKVKSIQKDKDNKIKNADFGVAGLEVNDECVIYNGLPFSSMSTAQQIEVSTLIAMKQNPKLKIILIREGALIGSKIWESIVSLAEKHDYQLWVERFQENPGSYGIHIQDGNIVSIDGENVSGNIEEIEI